MDPNSIIGAGVAAVTTVGIAATAVLGPLLGVGLGAAAGDTNSRS